MCHTSALWGVFFSCTAKATLNKYSCTKYHIAITILILFFYSQLQQASEVSQMRGARVISAEDLIFLMRKDKVQ